MKARKCKKKVHSLGALRPNQYQSTNPKSPRYVGKIRIQRDLLDTLVEQRRETGSDEVVCELAGWVNTDDNGPFLTVQLSSRYTKKTTPPRPNTLESFFDAGEEGAV